MAKILVLAIFGSYVDMDTILHTLLKSRDLGINKVWVIVCIILHLGFQCKFACVQLFTPWAIKNVPLLFLR